METNEDEVAAQILRLKYCVSNIASQIVNRHEVYR